MNARRFRSVNSRQNKRYEIIMSPGKCNSLEVLLLCKNHGIFFSRENLGMISSYFTIFTNILGSPHSL